MFRRELLSVYLSVSVFRHVISNALHRPCTAFGLSSSLVRKQAFNQWRDVRLKHPALEREFLRRSFLSYNTLAMMCQMRKQFFDHLVAIGFVSEPPTDGWF